MNLAHVVFIDAIRPHPDPEVTRLEVIRVVGGTEGPLELVTGKHYRVGLRGIRIKPGAYIPGWLAHDLWLVGKKRAEEWFEVRSIPIRGVESPGLFCGEAYMKDGTLASATRYSEMQAAGGTDSGGWITWPHWNLTWRVGDDVTDELGIKDRAQLPDSWKLVRKATRYFGRDPGDESNS